MRTQEEQAARLVWQYGEPIHAVLFFASMLCCGLDRTNRGVCGA